MALLYGRAGRLTAQNGGFRSGQCEDGGAELSRAELAEGYQRQRALIMQRHEQEVAALTAAAPTLLPDLKFHDLVFGKTLGAGAFAEVRYAKQIKRLPGQNVGSAWPEYAVKVIEKRPGFYCRAKVLKEIEIYHLCRGQQNIIQLIEFFEETDSFFLVFEKIEGGPLLDHIQSRICFTEAEASAIAPPRGSAAGSSSGAASTLARSASSEP